MKALNRIAGLAPALVALALAGCGGGSSGASGIDWPAAPSWPLSPNKPGAPDTPSTPNTPTDPSLPVSTGDNVVPVTISALAPAVNTPTVSIQLCGPGQAGGTQCETVDNILVDTGSTGLRVMSSAISSGLRSRLPLQTTPDVNMGGALSPLAQCAQFASGFTWGTVRLADTMIGSKTASNIPIELVGDGSYPTPADCNSLGGPDMSNSQALGANGILGIGHGVRDYPGVASTPYSGVYYACPVGGTCASTTVPLERQVMNPVAAFAKDNNGTIIRLSAIPAQGKDGLSGELVFGVGTQSNNTLPASATTIAVDQYGYFTTQYKGRTITESAIDSGTNGFAFDDATIPTASSDEFTWYTPASPLALSATLIATGGTGSAATVQFSVVNPYSFPNNYRAYNNIGWSYSRMFLWGLPFFYGRDVYTVMEGATVGQQRGPFVAFN